MGTTYDKHTYSLEKLYHYQCCNCYQWWTIGDKLLKKAHCPKCGTKARVVDINET